MLIDTKQIINLTNLRHILGRTVDEVSKGKIFYVSKKGQIKAIFAPVTLLEKKEEKNSLYQKIIRLRGKTTKEFTKQKEIWNSTEVIRKMRDKRNEKLGKLID